MQLKKLEILNLASLDRPEGEVIDFEHGALKDCTIFSIVGPTGSGKSTILDAICLALYNRAPRYPRRYGESRKMYEIFGEKNSEEKNRLSPIDCRNILTRGKKEGYSKLTFLANNGQLYRAEWYVRFQRVRFDNTLTTLYRLTLHNGQWVEEQADWNSLPTIIGLDYEQFLRTVLIAQGSFASFLTAEENERYELLEKLVGCEDLYTSIARRIKDQKTQAAEAYQQLRANFAAFEKDLISEEELPLLQEKIYRLEEVEKKLKEELVKLNEALTWYKTEESLTTRIAAFQQALTEAEQALQRTQTEKERLTLYDTTRPAQDLYKEEITARNLVTRYQQDEANLLQKIGRQEALLKQQTDALASLQQEETLARQTLDAQKPHINRARILEGELSAAQQTVNEKEKAKLQNEKEYRQAAAAVPDILQAVAQSDAKVHAADAVISVDITDAEDKKDIADANTKADAEDAVISVDITDAEDKKDTTDANKKDDAEDTKADTTDVNTKTDAADIKDKSPAQQQLERELHGVSEAFEAEQLLIQDVDVNQLQSRQTDAQQQEHDLQEAIRVLTDHTQKQDTLQQNLHRMQQLNLRNQAIEQAQQLLTIDALTAEIETLHQSHTLMTSENWTLHRHRLTDGQACPLCGATSHPYSREEVWQPVVSELARLIAQKKEVLTRQQQEQKKLTAECGQNTGQLQSLADANARLQTEITGLLSQWHTLHQSHPAWPAALTPLQALLPQVSLEARQAAQALTAYHTAARRVEQLRQTREAARNLLKAMTEWQEALLTRNRHHTALLREIGTDTPDALETRLTDRLNRAVTAHSRHKEAMATTQESLKGLGEQLLTTRENLTRELTRSQQLHHTLVEWLSTHCPQHTPEVIAQLCTATDAWDTIRQRQTLLQNQLTKAQTTLRNELLTHEQHQRQKPDAPCEELLERKAQVESQSTAELTDAKARLQRHLSAREQMGQLFEPCQAAEQRKQEWEEINDAIGGDGKTLRKIAQCYTLRFLVEHANVEIRKFNHRYELQQVPNSLCIRVIDHDRADDIRETTSLSGGETFIVSLGLALGLSALSSRNISFENLFIDEGFGTLDPDTLATVIDSLAMLQSSQGKKVGVISHTDTMSERITTQIRVIKNGDSGSSRIEIYP